MAKVNKKPKLQVTVVEVVESDNGTEQIMLVDMTSGKAVRRLATKEEEDELVKAFAESLGLEKIDEGY